MKTKTVRDVEEYFISITMFNSNGFDLIAPVPAIQEFPNKIKRESINGESDYETG